MTFFSGSPASGWTRNFRVARVRGITVNQLQLLQPYCQR